MRQLVIPELSPKTPINNIFCIGRNYVNHAKELNNPVPEEPVVFMKPTSSIIFDGGLIMLPPQSEEVHHEVELVIAIGREGKHIPKKRALEYIMGYGIGIDVTARDLQQKAKEKGHPWTIAKGFDTFTPISRFITPGQVGDPHDLNLKLEVNGEVRQDGSTADMIFPIESLVAYLSTIFTLSPGDLIFTGTPAGVSRVNAGDEIKASLNDDLISMYVSVTHEPHFQ